MVGFWRWICRKPRVAMLGMQLPDNEFLPDQAEPIYWFWQPIGWYDIPKLRSMRNNVLKQRPGDHFIAMVPYVEHVALCRDIGIRAVFCSHNAGLDERLFSAKPAAQQPYNAVYNARMLTLKRHELANQVEGKVLFIGGARNPKDSPEHFKWLQEIMPQHTFTHANTDEIFPTEQISKWLTQSRVGLCLSAKEGGMYSSTEYLLSGLPVVSTVCESGREAHYDVRFCRLVQDTPAAVAHSVKELIALNIDRHFVRRETIKKMRVERQNFIDELQLIFDANNCDCDASRFFYSQFQHKIFTGMYWKAEQKDIRERILGTLSKTSVAR